MEGSDRVGGSPSGGSHDILLDVTSSSISGGGVSVSFAAPGQLQDAFQRPAMLLLVLADLRFSLATLLVRHATRESL